MEISERGFWNQDKPQDLYDDHQLLNGLKIIFNEYDISNLVDFGCGNAFYVRKLKETGLSCDAYDGNPYTNQITEGLANVLDLTTNFELNKVFECVLSLEVGEHIPEKYEDTFLDNITKHSSNLIILSWAVEGQAGTGHINCKNNDYVIEKMAARKFKYLDKESSFLRNSAEMFWFKNTIMVFTRELNFESFIISIKSDKYKVDDRRKNILQNIIPKVSQVMNVSIFDAITPKDLKIENNIVFFEDKISIKRGHDRNINQPTTLKHCSLTLGHYKLFQYAVISNKNLLIFEDDVVIDNEYFHDFVKSIESFNSMTHPSILYLQSQCPWGGSQYPKINGRVIREIPSHFLFEIEKSNILKLNHDWIDVAGTTCYCINPKGASEMIDLINKVGLLNIDQITQMSLNQKKIHFYVSNNYKNMTYCL